MTSLQINGSSAAATTLAAAGKLFSATSGTSGNVSTKVGTSTQFKQMFAKGTSTNQSGVASLPAPTDSNFAGWMWDVTTLEGQRIAAGTWTPTFSLLASTGTTVTPTVQWYKRSSAGIYTQIGSVAGSSIALTTSAQSLTFTPPSLSAIDFATGDKLVMWLWVNQTAGGATNSTISVVEDTGGTAGVASAAQAATPGYAPTPVSLAVTLTGTGTLTCPGSESLYKATVLADAPLRYYRLDASSGIVTTDLGSQAQNGTLTGGVTLGQASLLKGDSDSAELFDGSTGYSSAPTTGLPTASPWSLEAWVNIPVTPSSFGAVIGLGNTGTSTDIELCYRGSGAFSLVANGATGTAATNGSALTPNTTYHLIGTYDGSNLRLYINGSIAATSSPLSGYTIAYGVCYIGNNDGGDHFHGVIDEAAIYSTALSSTQASNHYTAGTTPLPLALATALNGTLTGTGTLNGTLSTSSGGISLSTTLPGVGTLTSTLAVTLALAETCVGTGTLAPTLSASLALPAATLAGVGTLSGMAQLTTALAATLVGVGTLTPTLSLAAALAVTCTSTGTLSETLSAQAALSGTLTGSGTLSMGSPSLAAALADTMTGTGTLTPTLGAATALVGEADGRGTLAVLLSLATTLSCECDGVGTLTASLSTSSGGSVALSCECDGVGTLTSTLTATAPLVVTGTGTGTLVVSSPTLATTLAATLSGMGTLTPTLSASLALPSIQLPGSAQLTTSLTASAPLVVTMTGTSQLAMSAPSLSTALTAFVPGVSTLSCALLASLAITGTLAGDGTIDGALSLSTALSASLMGISALSVGNPSLATALFAECTGQGTLLATLTLILYAMERATTWRARDLAGTWTTRDLTGTWRTRDTTDTWQTRDQAAAWEARDLVTTWKED